MRDTRFGAVLFAASLVGCIASTTSHVRAEAGDPRLEFVTEYIRELSAQENIRAIGEKELADASTDKSQLDASKNLPESRLI